MNISYEGRIKIYPKKHQIEADVQLTYIIKEDRTKELVLYLYQDLEIDDITGEELEYYEYSKTVVDWCKFVPESKKITLYITKPLDKGKSVFLHFTYHGTINICQYHVNRIEESFVELGLYSPYFPLTENLEKADFLLNVYLPKDYHLVNGVKENDHYTIVEKDQNDCTLIASNQFKILQKDSISIYYINEASSEVAKDFQTYSEMVLKYFTSLFTKPSHIEKHSIVILPRELGGAYCRPRLLSFQNLTERSKDYLPFLGHELGHLWWHKAPSNSYEDWLNESFAQYASLLIIKKYFGESALQKVIQKYEEEIKDTPPIYEIDRASNEAYTVLYIKGSYILYQLEQSIGFNHMIDFLKQVHINKITSTKDLLKLLTTLEGKKIADQLEIALKS